MNALKRKQHKGLDWSYDLEEIGPIWHPSHRQKFPHLFDHEGVCKRMYGDYPGGTTGFHLKVYRSAS